MEYLRDIPLFVAVAQARSFSRAAAGLGVPTSSLSRRITDLEASLGLQLLARSTRVVELTEAGALYLERCLAIMDAADQAQRQVRGLAETPQGLLRLSVEAEIGPRLVAPLIASYLERYPAVTVDLDLSPRRVDLLAENFDLAIRLGRLVDSTLTVRRLALLRAGLFASPAYLERRGTPANPADLAGHARIRLLHQGDRGEWRLSRGEESFDVDAASLVSANNMAMIRELARLGVGIAVLDVFLASDDVDSGRLRQVLPDWSLPPTALSVLTPTRLVPAKTRRFVDMLAGAVSGTVGLAPER